MTLTLKGKRIRKVTLWDEVGHLATYLGWPGGWTTVVQRVEDDGDAFADGVFADAHDGGLYCLACRMLAAPGDEEFDWCDHLTGEGCSYFHERDADDD